MTGPHPPAAARRVLVVDDNEDAAESLAILLRLAGHSVRVALGGHAALAALIAPGGAADVALIDLGMPGMNGLELAATLRAHFGDRCPLLVALTGYGHETMRASARAAGFAHHVVKSADPQLVLEIVAGASRSE